ncbi:MAG: glycosyltransferase family 4 protein [Cyanobacteria bacterium REEB65]|nr:glycosyltransferase family 4 protein [Cyanobacteria bacterium REEB65]
MGHLYILAFNQQKYAEIARQAPATSIRLAIPDRSIYAFGGLTPEIDPDFGAENIAILPVVFGIKKPYLLFHMTYLLSPWRLLRLLTNHRPTRIHIEEDPHAFISVLMVFLARIVARNARISFFVWDNVDHSPRFPLNLLKRGFQRYTFAHADLVVCGNRDAQALLPQKGFNGQSVVLPQFGVAMGDTPPKVPAVLQDLLSRRADKLLIGCYGRLDKEKGILDLLEALSGLQELPWQLWLMGKGELEQEIDGPWMDRLQGRLIRLDPAPYKDVVEYLAPLDIFVVASHSTPHWKEQFALTMVQALILGIPCITSTSGALPEVMGPGGISYEEGNSSALREALRSLIASKTLRMSLGKSGRDHALANYTVEAVAKAHLAAFSSAEIETR